MQLSLAPIITVAAAKSISRVVNYFEVKKFFYHAKMRVQKGLNGGKISCYQGEEKGY